MKSLGPLPPPPAVGGQQIVNIDEAKDLVDSVGDTTILKKNYRGPGHFQLHGGAITLPALFYQFGEECKAMELMLWHWNAEKVAKKRDHPVGSADRRGAALVRKEETGYWGFEPRWG